MRRKRSFAMDVGWPADPLASIRHEAEMNAMQYQIGRSRRRAASIAASRCSGF